MHCFACQSAIGPDDSWCSKCGAAVRQRVDPDSERRFVTILRADVVDSTGLVAELDPEAAVSRLEPALAAMRASVRQFGGIVSKELGDGLAAVFGAPIADDNHAPLACHAAIELVRRVGSLGDPGLQVRVGLHSGHVVAYMVASEFSKVYEIGGAAQHLAARLERQPRRTRSTSRKPARSLPTDMSAFDFLGRKSLRGFSQPVPVYRIIGASDLSSWRVRRARSVSRFVDRTTGAGAAVARGRAGRAGRQTVLLMGDAGIGKSRLAHEFAQELRADGWRLIDAECSPNLQGAPFSTLKRMLLSAHGCSSQETRNRRQIPERNCRRSISLLSTRCCDLPISDPALGRIGASCAGTRDLGCKLRNHPEAWPVARPTVLLIEDLHWIDRASDVGRCRHCLAAGARSPRAAHLPAERHAGLDRALPCRSRRDAAARRRIRDWPCCPTCSDRPRPMPIEEPDHLPHGQRAAVHRGGLPGLKDSGTFAASGATSLWCVRSTSSVFPPAFRA